MGPKNQYTAHPREFDESDVDRTPEYEEFIEKLRDFHEKRGTLAYTNFEPDIQRKKVDLLKLYKLIVQKGGYTLVSQKTGLWKELAVNFNPPQHNTNIGFVLKTIYWKNLGAWECVNHWNEEAPVPEAIEHQSAAGSDLVGRKPPESIENSSPALLTRGRSGGGEPSGSTPTTTPSGRTLREAPPKRQFFQPEVSTPRPRNPVAPSQSPALQPTINGKGSTSGGGSHSMNINSAEQNPLPPANIVPIFTPYSHPQKFLPVTHKNGNVHLHELRPMPQEEIADKLVERAVMGIQSRLPQELYEGLQTILRITSLPGFSIYFRDSPSLAHDLLALIEDCANVSADEQPSGELKPWAPSEYRPISSLKPPTINSPSGSLEPVEWRKKMDLGLHAIDILRNMTARDNNYPAIENNIRYLAAFHPNTIPILMKGLCTPKSHQFNELRRICLGVIDALSLGLDIADEAKLVDIIWEGIDDDDLTTVVLKLSVMVNLSVKEKTGHMKQIPAAVLEYLENLLMSKDERLLIATLDFFYHFTLLDEGTALLTQRPDAIQKLSQMIRLLSYGTVRIPPDPAASSAKSSSSNKKAVPQVTPELPADLLSDILRLNEPQRAIWWIRSSFEANPDSEITQIALWQAYQRQFGGYTNAGPKAQPLLQANDFIKNVSVAFTGARPQMIPGENGQPSRFVINGIAPREEPMGLDCEVYLRCDWRVPKDKPATASDAPDSSDMKPCGQFFPNCKSLYEHVRDKHTFLNQKAEGISETQICRWRDCTRFPAPGTDKKIVFYKHLLAHMPLKIKDILGKGRKGSILASDTAKAFSAPVSKKVDTIKTPLGSGLFWTIEVSANPKQDESIGVPIMAARVLRNLSTTESQDGIENLLFFKNAIFDKMALTTNKTLLTLLADYICNITAPRTADAPIEEAMMIDPPSDSDY
ncbi:Chromatin structure-remodeling complex protein rsc9 [Orbilia ellipsospora]|uniref:Chromatin structure-remodeling complex protein rsc9 n=1 Tax=Orbilia ellipsospora TaxID=2528407 RepID=A0AAV9XB84_9PEZI